MPKYSLITTVNLNSWNQEKQDRVNKFLKCIQSVKNINYKDFEWVVIDDGSPLEFLWSNIDQALDIPNCIILHKIHGERVLAYNEAFKVAKGDWWTFLDSDDEIDPEVFNILDREIKVNKRFKMFNFGSVHNWVDGTVQKRDPFKPKMLKKGHEEFGAGNIVNGTFVFNKVVYEKCGGYFMDQIDDKGYIRDIDCTEINYPAFNNQPKPYIRDLFLGTPYDFSAAFQLKFPETRKFYMVKHPDHPENIVKELGNPWGQDYALFYQYTRKFHSHPIQEYLYIVNHRL